jgi:Flp pilus assembly protein TadG
MPRAAIRTIRGKTRAFRASRRGNVAMMFAFLVVPLVLAGGLAIDFARSSQAEAIVQEAADAAALRAARAKIDDPNLSAAQLSGIADKVFRTALSHASWIEIKSVSVEYDEKSRSLSVGAQTAVKTSLLRIAGYEEMDAGRTSEVTIGKAAPIEVALSLDVTGSMNQKNKIGDLRDSASDLVENLFAASSAAKVSVVPFAQYVNVGADAKGAPWLQLPKGSWSGCVGSRPYPANISDSDYNKIPVPGLQGNSCPPPILPLTSDKAAALKVIRDLKADGWTYIPDGLVWGWRTLSPHAPFTGGMTKASAAETKALRAIVLLTDGMNTRAPDYPSHNSTDAKLADKLLAEACAVVKKDDIVIYTIAFDLTDKGIKKLLADCASEPGFYFDAQNSRQLASAFRSIGASITTMRLTR